MGLERLRGQQVGDVNPESLTRSLEGQNQRQWKGLGSFVSSGLRKTVVGTDCERESQSLFIRLRGEQSVDKEASRGQCHLEFWRGRE